MTLYQELYKTERNANGARELWKQMRQEAVAGSDEVGSWVGFVFLTCTKMYIYIYIYLCIYIHTYKSK